MAPGNDDLHPILSRIHETLGDVLTNVRRIKGELEKVREAITEGVETIQDAVHDSIQAQAELQMMEHVGAVEAIEPQITAEQERVESEQAELEAQLDRIADRYERRHEELDETAAERVRNLGAHIFEIDEDEFERSIEGPFTDHVTATWSSFRQHNQRVEDDRRGMVEGTSDDVAQSVQEFVDQQHELLEEIRSQRVDLDVAVSEPTTVQVPYYSITLDVDGRTERHLVVPSEVEPGYGIETVDLSPLPGLADIVSRTSTGPAREERLDAADLTAAATEHLGEAPPLLSYDAAMESALGDSVSLTVEGGEH